MFFFLIDIYFLFLFNKKKIKTLKAIIILMAYLSRYATLRLWYACQSCCHLYRAALYFTISIIKKEILFLIIFFFFFFAFTFGYLSYAVEWLTTTRTFCLGSFLLSSCISFLFYYYFMFYDFLFIPSTNCQNTVVVSDYF